MSGFGWILEAILLTIGKVFHNVTNDHGNHSPRLVREHSKFLGHLGEVDSKHLLRRGFFKVSLCSNFAGLNHKGICEGEIRNVFQLGLDLLVCCQDEFSLVESGVGNADENPPNDVEFVKVHPGIRGLRCHAIQCGFNVFERWEKAIE